MKFNETPWESVGLHLWRFKVDGGYLYSISDSTLCFVPTIHINKPEPFPYTTCEHGYYGSCPNCNKIGDIKY
jgi:hypothetical protein